MNRRIIASTGVLAVLIAVAAPLRAEDRTSYLRSVTVGPMEITDEIVCILCSVRIRGAVQGDVISIGGNIEVDGSVSGDVIATGGTIHLASSARLSGDAVAVGGFVAQEPGAYLSQNSDRTSVPWIHLPGQRHIGWRGAIALLAFNSILVSLAALVLRPRRLRVIGAACRRWILSGLLGTALVLLLSYLLDLSDKLGRFSDAADFIVIGIFLILLSVGTSGIAMALGEMSLPSSTSVALLMGTAAIVLLQLLPVVGALVFLLLVILACGAAAWSGLGFRGGRAAAQNR